MTKDENIKSLIEIINFKNYQLSELRKEIKSLKIQIVDIKQEYNRVAQSIMEELMSSANNFKNRIFKIDSLNTIQNQTKTNHYGFKYSIEDIQARFDLSRKQILAEATSYETIKINNKHYFREEFYKKMKTKYNNKLFECWK